MNPPTYFNKEERAIWREIVRASPVPITDADCPALEILVAILHKQRNRIELSANERSTALKLLMEFRATPAARAKTHPTDKPADNEFANL